MVKNSKKEKEMMRDDSQSDDDSYQQRFEHGSEVEDMESDEYEEEKGWKNFPKLSSEAQFLSHVNIKTYTGFLNQAKYYIARGYAPLKVVRTNDLDDDMEMVDSAKEWKWTGNQKSYPVICSICKRLNMSGNFSNKHMKNDCFNSKPSEHFSKLASMEVQQDSSSGTTNKKARKGSSSSKLYSKDQYCINQVEGLSSFLKTRIPVSMYLTAYQNPKELELQEWFDWRKLHQEQEKHYKRSQEAKKKVQQNIQFKQIQKELLDPMSDLSKSQQNRKDGEIEMEQDNAQEEQKRISMRELVKRLSLFYAGPKEGIKKEDLDSMLAVKFNWLKETLKTSSKKELMVTLKQISQLIRDFNMKAQDLKQLQVQIAYLISNDPTFQEEDEEEYSEDEPKNVKKTRAKKQTQKKQRKQQDNNVGPDDNRAQAKKSKRKTLRKKEKVESHDTITDNEDEIKLKKREVKQQSKQKAKKGFKTRADNLKQIDEVVEVEELKDQQVKRAPVLENKVGKNSSESIKSSNSISIAPANVVAKSLAAADSKQVDNRKDKLLNSEPFKQTKKLTPPNGSANRQDKGDDTVNTHVVPDELNSACQNLSGQFQKIKSPTIQQREVIVVDRNSQEYIRQQRIISLSSKKPSPEDINKGAQVVSHLNTLQQRRQTPTKPDRMAEDSLFSINSSNIQEVQEYQKDKTVVSNIEKKKTVKKSTTVANTIKQSTKNDIKKVGPTSSLTANKQTSAKSKIKETTGGLKQSLERINKKPSMSKKKVQDDDSESFISVEEKLPTKKSTTKKKGDDVAETKPLAGEMVQRKKAISSKSSLKKDKTAKDQKIKKQVIAGQGTQKGKDIKAKAQKRQKTM